MFCKKCGEKIKDYNGVCPLCGYDNGYLKGNGSDDPERKVDAPFDRLSPAGDVSDVSIESRIKAVEKKIKHTRAVSLFHIGEVLFLLLFCIILSVTTGAANGAADRELKRASNDVTASVREMQDKLEKVQKGITTIQNNSETVQSSIDQLIEANVGDEDVQDDTDSEQSYIDNSEPSEAIVWQSPRVNIISQDGNNSLCIVASGKVLTFNWQTKGEFGDWENIDYNRQPGLVFTVDSGDNYSVLAIQDSSYEDTETSKLRFRCMVTFTSGVKCNSKEMTFVNYRKETAKENMEIFEDDDTDGEERSSYPAPTPSQWLPSNNHRYIEKVSANQSKT